MGERYINESEFKNCIQKLIDHSPCWSFGRGQPRRVYKFRINSRDELIRVFINDLVLNTPVSKTIIDMSDSHIAHNKEQITTGFYNTCDFTFDTFMPCLKVLRERLK